MAFVQRQLIGLPIINLETLSKMNQEVFNFIEKNAWELYSIQTYRRYGIYPQIWKNQEKLDYMLEIIQQKYLSPDRQEQNHNLYQLAYSNLQIWAKRNGNDYQESCNDQYISNTFIIDAFICINSNPVMPQAAGLPVIGKIALASNKSSSTAASMSSIPHAKNQSGLKPVADFVPGRKIAIASNQPITSVSMSAQQAEKKVAATVAPLNASASTSSVGVQQCVGSSQSVAAIAGSSSQHSSLSEASSSASNSSSDLGHPAPLDTQQLQPSSSIGGISSQSAEKKVAATVAPLNASASTSSVGVQQCVGISQSVVTIAGSSSQNSMLGTESSSASNSSIDIGFSTNVSASTSSVGVQQQSSSSMPSVAELAASVLQHPSSSAVVSSGSNFAILADSASSQTPISILNSSSQESETKDVSALLSVSGIFAQQSAAASPAQLQPAIQSQAMSSINDSASILDLSNEIRQLLTQCKPTFYENIKKSAYDRYTKEKKQRNEQCSCTVDEFEKTEYFIENLIIVIESRLKISISEKKPDHDKAVNALDEAQKICDILKSRNISEQQINRHRIISLLKFIIRGNEKKESLQPVASSPAASSSAASAQADSASSVVSLLAGSSPISQSSQAQCNAYSSPAVAVSVINQSSQSQFHASSLPAVAVTEAKVLDSASAQAQKPALVSQPQVPYSQHERFLKTISEFGIKTYRGEQIQVVNSMAQPLTINEIMEWCKINIYRGHGSTPKVDPKVAAAEQRSPSTSKFAHIVRFTNEPLPESEIDAKKLMADAYEDLRIVCFAINKILNQKYDEKINNIFAFILSSHPAYINKFGFFSRLPLLLVKRCLNMEENQVNPRPVEELKQHSSWAFRIQHDALPIGRSAASKYAIFLENTLPPDLFNCFKMEKSVNQQLVSNSGAFQPSGRGKRSYNRH